MRLARLAALAFAIAAFPGPAAAETVYTVDNGAPALLAKFDSATPGTVTTIGPVTGMAAGETVLAIDFRPVDGRLYAVANSRVYTIDTSTAVATLVGTAPYTPAIPSNGNIGADFDPARDVLRVINDSVGGPATNLRVSPTTGQAITDTPPNNTPDDSVANGPCIASLAYTNNFSGATATTLFGVAYCGDPALIRIGSVDGAPFPADSGRFSLVEHTTPGVFPQQFSRAGFDIAPGGIAYALVQQGPSVYFYEVDLREGAYTLNLVGILGSQPTGPGVAWRDIAVAPAANDFSFSAPSYSVGETAGSATVTVTRAGPAIGTSSVAYSTADGSATSPFDYTPTGGTLNFTAGQRSATFSVPIADDSLFEGPESLGLVLSAPAGGAAALVEPSGGTVVIESDDPAPPAPLTPGAAALDTTPPTLALSQAKLAAAGRVPEGRQSHGDARRACRARASSSSRRSGARGSPVAGRSSSRPRRCRSQPGARTTTLKPSRRLVGKPRKAFTVRLQVTATDAAGNRKVDRKTISVKPDKKKKRVR